MAHPTCREAINRRVSGSIGAYPLDHLYTLAGSPLFQKALSLGCGTGRLERSMARLGIAAEIDAIDGSQVSINIARRKALEEGVSTVHYRVADLNGIRLPRRAYDAVVFHQSLHHVSSVEKLLEGVQVSLKPGGLLFLDEWVGPSRLEWSERTLAHARSLFSAVPAPWRKWADLRAPIEVDDPSEAVRSSAILPAVDRLFSIQAERAYGGNLVAVILPQLNRSLIPPGELEKMITGWLAIEDAELEQNQRSSYYTAILATPRHGPSRLVGRAASLLTRTRMALRYRVLPALRRVIGPGEGSPSPA